MEQKTALVYTLGCRVNTCESLSFADRLSENGFKILAKNSNKTPDVVFVNTCAVTAESARKSKQIVRRYRQKFPESTIVAAGCAVQAGENFDADIVFGNGDKDEIAKLCLSGKPSEKIVSVPDAELFEKCSDASYITPYKSRCHIKIEDGCDSKCAYCIIPSLRGHVRSKDPEKLISEIKSRVSDGAKEIVLTGIETGSYGKDLENISLAHILEEADKLDGLYLIRLGSMDPFSIDDEFIERISKLKHFENHFHLSVQSGCSKTLAAMKRKYNAERLWETIEKLYEKFPDIALTADIITGFPGETDEDFEKTLEFAKKAKFLHMHIFPYSERSGTVACEMDGKVPVETRHRRAEILGKVNIENKQKRLESAVGKVETVHFETKKGGLNTGYTRSYMPVTVECDEDLKGQVRKVKIEKVENLTLIGGTVD